MLHGIVGVAQLFGRKDDDLVAAARHDAVQPLEIGMPLDPLGIGIEQVESVVGAEPEERVGRHGDLLDEVSRERLVAAPVVRVQVHPFAVPHVQSVAGADPDVSVTVLCQ